MSFANQFGKLFNRKPAPAEAEAGAEGNSDLLGGLKSEVQHRWLIFNEW